MIKFEDIKDLQAANKAIEDNEDTRNNCLNSIVGSSVTSKFTNLEGSITGINKKSIFVNYECWQSIPVSIERYKDVLNMDDYLIKLIDEYFETYTNERKLNRLTLKLANETQSNKKEGEDYD